MLSTRTLTVTLAGVFIWAAGLPGASAQAPVPQSISNPPPLVPGKIQGTYEWLKPGFSLKSYGKVIIEPPSFVIHDESEEKVIKPEELQLSGQALRSHIIDAMEPEYPVVNKPGPGVLLIRPAITNLKLKKEKRVARGIFGYLPVGAAVNVVQSAAGRSLEISDAVFEAEGVDSVSGERLGVMIDPQIRERAGEHPSWESLNLVFQLYARTLRQRFDEAHKN